MFGAIFSLLIFVVIAVLLIRRLTSPGGARPGRSPYSLRRVFQYLVLFGLVVIVGIGVSGLVARFFEDDSFVAGTSAALARSLAFTVVGVPILAGLVVWTRRRFAQSSGEGDTPEWGLYITAASITSLGVTIAAATQLIQWALGSTTFEGSAVGQLLVWGAIWAIHYRLSTTITTFERARPAHIFASVIGIAVAIGGVVALLSAALERVMFSTTSLVVNDRDLKEGAAALVVGAIVWFLYWVRRVLHSERDTLWLAYVLLVGVAGGLAMLVIAASTALYRVAVWLIGDPSAPTAAGHFASLPTLIAVAAVGTVIWWYHRAVLASGPAAGRTEVNRIYEYLIAGIGLIAAAAGVATIIIAIFDAMTGSTVIAGGSAINTLLAAITLMVVGVPFWWTFWSRAQAEASANPAMEVPSASRRTYLFLLFGVGGITAIISLLVAVYAFFSDLVDSDLSLQTVRDMRIPLSILIATGLVSGYHVLVYRRDRELGITETVRGPRFVLLVGGDERLRQAIVSETGAHVQAWSGPDGATAGVDEVLSLLRAHTDEQVLILDRATGVEVIPIRHA